MPLQRGRTRDKARTLGSRSHAPPRMHELKLNIFHHSISGCFITIINVNCEIRYKVVKISNMNFW